METIKFLLSGKTAMFKKPDVNVKTYFTYNNIHKIALIGLLGAITGLKGYGEKGQDYPEFYRLLYPLKISIVPERLVFDKKIQYFNNSIGYASHEEGGNLQVFEQWLEHPKWQVYLLYKKQIHEELWNKLKDYLLNGKCEYIPYLGKNDHPASISECELITMKKEKVPYITSLFLDEFNLKETEIDDENTYSFKRLYNFIEVAPYALSSGINDYEYKQFRMTNAYLEGTELIDDLYLDGEDSIAFY